MSGHGDEEEDGNANLGSSNGSGWQIERLREMLHKWQSMALGGARDQEHHHHERTTGSALMGISPAMNRRLKCSLVPIDSDEESCQSPDPPPDVPKGYLAVHVGPELRRFVIPTDYLSLPVFKVLLEKAEEEFGFDNKGALTFPIEIETFKYILQCLEHHYRKTNGGDGFINENWQC
ncbi:Indole-3-acetic acid-induced protein ARG7 [Acorus calamus]|uniref:Indole-3-acetic acid-induced protein ARG7 n=1 Tax=Acorus calamus TaxID=4465 RepID=A0AAV9CHU3_ACOCL|nr:Indole-3-acetic acid-induced protein ARG7 [Acorus calamus]